MRRGTNMRKIISYILILFIIAGLSTGCGGQKTVDSSFNLSEPLIGSVDNSGASIGDLESNGVSLDIAVDAFATAQTITMSPVDEYEVPDKNRAQLLSAPLKIDVDQDLKRFDAPITIKMSLTNEEVEIIEQGDEIWGAYYNGSDWDFIKPSIVDTEKRFIAFNTYHFSTYSKAQVEKDEIINKFSESNALEQWNARNGNTAIDEETKSLIKDILVNKMGLGGNPTLEEDIIAAVLKEDAYINLLNDYSEGNVDAYSQTIALLAGEKIVDIISEYPESVAGEILSNVTEHASKIGTGVQMATHLVNGEYTEAMKALSNEIIDSYPLTKMLKTAAEITERQIARWKDQELEAAYQVYKNGAESDIPWWGYNAEKGNFEDVWSQMKGLQTKVLSDAKADEAARMGVAPDQLGEKVLEGIRVKAKENLKKEFEERVLGESEIEKIKNDNLKLIEVYRKANLLEKYRYGYTESTDLEQMLDRLFRLKARILKDTKSRMTNVDLPDKGEISAETIAILSQIWYTQPDGKEKYAEKLVELGYAEPAPDLLMTLKINGVAGIVDYTPELEYEAIGYFMDTIPINSDGTINVDFPGGKTIKIPDALIFRLPSPGKTLTLESAQLRGKFDAARNEGSGTLSINWRILEEAGSGIDYEKYDVKRSLTGDFRISEAYGEPNKSRGHLYLEIYGKAEWDQSYTGKSYDPEKQEYFLETSSSSYPVDGWGGTYSYEVVKP
jgi:hypothetical protein